MFSRSWRRQGVDRNWKKRYALHPLLLLTGIVCLVEPVLHERELRLVVQLLRGDV